MVMTAVMAEDDIVLAQSVTDADRDRLLPSPEMSRRAHLLFLVALRQAFLRQPDLQQLMMERDEKTRIHLAGD